MTLTKYERGNLWESRVTYTSGSSYVDCYENIANLTVYGPDEPIQYLRQQCDTLRVMSIANMKESFITYELIKIILL